MVLGLRGVPVRGGVRPPLRDLTRRRARRGRAHRARMARIVVAGSGAIGASVAYHLALLGADDVVVAERGELVGGSTSRAMGGVRQQFSTAEEVVLARESIEFLARARAVALPAGRLPVPRDDRRRASRSSRSGARSRTSSASRSSASTRRSCAGSRSTTCSARRAAGATASPTRPAVAREVLRLAQARGVERARAHAGGGRRARRARDRVRPVVARARARRSASSCRSGRSAASCSRPRRSPGLPDELPMVIEAETRLPLPPSRRPARARDDRSGAALDVRDRRSTSRSSPTGSSGSRAATRRRPARRSRTPGPASTT